MIFLTHPVEEVGPHVARAQQSWTQSAGVALILSCAICADGLQGSCPIRRIEARSRCLDKIKYTGCAAHRQLPTRLPIRSTHEHGLAPNGPCGQRIIAVSYRARAAGKSAQYPTLPLGRRSAPFASLPRVARGWLFSARPYWRSERVDSPAHKGGQRQIDANDPTRTSPLSLPTAATTIQSDSGPPEGPDDAPQAH